MQLAQITGELVVLKNVFRSFKKISRTQVRLDVTRSVRGWLNMCKMGATQKKKKKGENDMVTRAHRDLLSLNRD